MHRQDDRNRECGTPGATANGQAYYAKPVPPQVSVFFDARRLNPGGVDGGGGGGDPRDSPEACPTLSGKVPTNWLVLSLSRERQEPVSG